MKSYIDLMAEIGVSYLHQDGLNSTKKMLNKIGIKETDRVLDVGCGTGGTARYLNKKYGCEVVGIDICKEMIGKLDKGLPPQIIHEIIAYLEKTKNAEFTLTLVKYLNGQNIQARNSLWALSSQIAMIGEDVGKIKQHLGVQ